MPNTKGYPTRRAGKTKAKSKANGANLGFEEKLWQASLLPSTRQNVGHAVDVAES